MKAFSLREKEYKINYGKFLLNYDIYFVNLNIKRGYILKNNLIMTFLYPDYENILVTGGTGMIGRYLVPLLIESNNNVTVASLDGEELCHPEANFKDLI